MKDKILMGLSVLLGLMMINSGLNKFIGYMPLPEMPEGAMNTMRAFVEAGWLMGLIAIAEIVGGALLAWPKTRALGAIVLFPVMVGIFLFNAVQSPGTIIVSIVLFGILLWIIYENRHRYMPMIKE